MPCRDSGRMRLAPAAFVCPAAESHRGIYNYRADAGAGSNTITVISESPGWRAMLLGTVAAGALWLGAPRDARAGPQPCVTSGTTATCQGNQSARLNSFSDFNPVVVDTLNINALTTDIMPSSTVDGIYFHRSGAGDTITINSDTNPFSIFVTGAGAIGINARAPGAVAIDHAGNITSTDSRGIYAASTSSSVRVNINGDIDAGTFGIQARGVGDVNVTTGSHSTVIGGSFGIEARNSLAGTGALTIIANGDVHGIAVDGVYALNQGTDFSVTSQSVAGGQFGIIGKNYNRALTVTAHGDVEGTTGTGIYAKNYGVDLITGKSLSVTSEGVTGGINGIYARNFGSGALTVTANGDVVGTSGDDTLRSTTTAPL